MVRITADFQQERVLHPAAMAQLNQSFAKGWADPNKLNANSRELAILLQQVRENFATALKVRPDEIEFLGESDLGFQLGISGLLKSNSKLIYSSIDRQRIFAVAADEENKGRKVDRLSVNQNGTITSYAAQENDVVVWQVANGETGNLQSSPPTTGLVFTDCTASGVTHYQTLITKPPYLIAAHGRDQQELAFWLLRSLISGAIPCPIMI